MLSMEKTPVIAVIGPTASGKSDFAVDLAIKIEGEIISADSRQIYRGLDIGTGKITKEEMRGVPHHMLSIKDIGEGFSVAEYAALVLPLIEEIQSRKKVPILCGGTGQYIHAVLYESSFPNVGPNKSLRKELGGKTTKELFLMLMEKDPNRAKTIDRHNKVRLVRALEILSSLPKVPEMLHTKPRFPFHIYNLSLGNEAMKDRITKRVENRLKQGMLDEVKKVIDMQLTEAELARLGIEYVELGKYLNRISALEDAKSSLIAKIYQYAKRQKTWNKKYFPDVEIIAIN